MGFVIYDHFADDTVNPIVPNQSQSPSSASPTKEPTLSDIGNIYGNITNDANVVLIDNREYFISADNNGDKHIYVTENNVTKDLIKTDASCLNVVTDYVTYAGKTSILPYYVFYINGDGKICYYYDYTGSDGVVDEKLFSENVFLDGVDHNFILQMRQRGEKIKVFPYRCDHAFSGTEKPPVKSALVRFRIYAKDYKYILGENKLAYYRLVGKRALHLTAQYKTLAFLKALYQAQILRK